MFLGGVIMNNELKRINRIIREYAEFGSPKYFVINNGDTIDMPYIIEDENPVYEIKTFADQIKAVKLLKESYNQIENADGKSPAGYIDSTVINSKDELVIYLNDAGAVRLKELYRKTPSKEVFFSELDKDAVGIDYDKKKFVFKNNGKSHPSLLEQNVIGSSDFFGEGSPDEYFTGRIDDTVDSENFESQNIDSFDYVANDYIN